MSDLNSLASWAGSLEDDCSHHCNVSFYWGVFRGIGIVGSFL